jgi:hypothetical protein
MCTSNRTHLSSEIQAIESFSVRAANCERPADRQHILAELRRSWGSEAAFDAFVREEMKAVLLSGKKRYMSTAPRAVQEAISFLFSSMGWQSENPEKLRRDSD